MRFHWLLPSVKGIPVLMYHRVWPGLNDGLTLTPEKLAEQWRYLQSEGYNAVSLQEYLQLATGARRRNGKEVLITFDDGYQNNLLYAYPLLQEMNWKASFFIIGDVLEGNIDADDPLNRKMTANELRSLNPSIVQLSMHGYHHENFSTTPPEAIKTAIKKSLNAFREHNILLHPSIAYPYGGRPKDAGEFSSLKQWMQQEGIEAAFRIGNQVSRIPAPDMYEIRRIDIRGTDTMEDFRIKLRKGKLKPF